MHKKMTLEELLKGFRRNKDEMKIAWNEADIKLSTVLRYIEELENRLDPDAIKDARKSALLEL